MSEERGTSTLQYARRVSDTYWHEVCFSGPEDATALIEAGEKAGFKFEQGSTKPEKGSVGLAGQRDEARQDLEKLRTRLADRRGEPSD